MICFWVRALLLHHRFKTDHRCQLHDPVQGTTPSFGYQIMKFYPESVHSEVVLSKTTEYLHASNPYFPDNSRPSHAIYLGQLSDPGLLICFLFLASQNLPDNIII